ncbi:hypothetical protein ATER59S_01700 [Aquamicrobium terrae]
MRLDNRRTYDPILPKDRELNGPGMARRGRRSSGGLRLKISHDFAAAMRATPHFDLRYIFNNISLNRLIREMTSYIYQIGKYSSRKLIYLSAITLSYVLMAPANAAETSPINCDTLVEWQERAKKDPIEKFGDEFLHYMVGSNVFEEVKQALKAVENCEIERYSGGDGKAFGEIRYKLQQYRGIKAIRHTPDKFIKSWILDLEESNNNIRNIPSGNDIDNLFLVFAYEHLIGSRLGPVEVSLSPQYDQLEKAIEDKRKEIYRTLRAQQQAADERQLADRMETAVAQYGAAVDDLGFPEAYLQANIVIEGLFENQRWITFREWLAALHLSGHFEKIEGSQLVGLDAYGVTLKQDSTRAYGLYFILQGNDLFLTYAGEVNAVRQIRRNEKFEYGLQLQGLIK